MTATPRLRTPPRDAGRRRDRSSRLVSELQQRDCASLLRMNRVGLDDAHLDRWARVLGIGDLLEAARHAS